MENERSRIVVTVDGLAGSGKSTLSRMLAEKLKFVHLNSGLLYRGVAFLALREKLSPDDGKELGALLKQHTVQLAFDDTAGSILLLDGADVTSRLQTPQISDATSRAAALPEVRAALISAQRGAFPERHLVAEGRDMGTVIFPDAQVKFFVVANEAVRVERRLKQLCDKGPGGLESQKNLRDRMGLEIVERDRRDAERSIAPAKPAPGAITVDNSTRSLTEVVESMYDSVLRLTQVSR